LLLLVMTTHHYRLLCIFTISTQAVKPLIT
jgi:hypothetical protein